MQREKGVQTMSFSGPCEAAWGKMGIPERELLLVELAVIGNRPSLWGSEWRRVARIEHYDDLPAGLQGELIIAFRDGEFSAAKYREGLQKISG
ncbi:MAG: hypothetical protein A3A44_03600 [Candidatus Sungbacteria bacterium RIFCSPLOWO2_01_FULL_60_25]|uniref:Uncharacterized protein n=1 Tax=Candidatus Sungbacteria bacterium RIFCSPLOWO2_01_FULL_60_25 TaxID=1802281 RepID=A0A1G2LF34_9BACT|nr:MAG: hypothetical protein A3A44_03600 [Candidatus Sungbacteria bacterium RIFCSPLOWO2_01_FULL_60_25]